MASVSTRTKLPGELTDPNTNVFGVPLEKAMQLETGMLLPGQDIPTVLDLIVSNLEVNGVEAEIFVSANPDDPAVLKKKRLLRIGSLPITIDEDPQVLAGLLKLYLQELPEPLIPIKCYNKVVEIAYKKFKGIKDKGGVQAIRELVESEFPPVNAAVCRRLFELFKTVMTSWWSSAQDSKLIVQTFAPYFLRTTPTLPKQLNSKELQIAIDVLGILVIHFESIFVESGQSEKLRRMSLIQKGERLSRRTSTTELASGVAQSVNKDPQALRRMLSTPELSLPADNPTKKSPRKLKTSDVLLILETENAKLRRELIATKEWASKAITDLQTQLNLTCRELADLKSLVQKMIDASPGLRSRLADSSSSVENDSRSSSSTFTELQSSK